MDRTYTIRLLANYNRWMNARVYDAAAVLPRSELTEDRNAYFGSIQGTLNHLAAGDTIWLQRFAEHPAEYAALEPTRELRKLTSLSQLLFSDFDEQSAYRKMLDGMIVDWTNDIGDSELDHVLNYKSMAGVASRKNFFGLLMHFFNHQTHHRGQVSTLLAQAGVDVGVTDLLVLLEEDA